MISSQQLTQCDKEPIHIPSMIQSIGYMLVIENKTNNIIQASKNTEELLDSKIENIIEKNICNYFDKEFINEVNIIKNSKNNDDDKNIPLSVKLKFKSYFVMMHKSEEFYILELVEQNSKTYEALHDSENIISKSMEYCSTDSTLQQLLEHIAKSVKEISGFDRVLVYKFVEDGHGTVLAQEKEQFCENFLHHYFPASDIPKQARELYVKNRFRLISDVNSATSNIVPNINPVSNSLLDMSKCYLRAVSSIHIEYLKNMGVTSSMSISIVIDNKLWGLIACHNYSVKSIAFKNYRTYDLLSQIYSSQIENKEFVNNHKTIFELQSKRRLFLKVLDSSEELNYKDSLSKHFELLKDTISCDVCVVFDGNDIIKSSDKICNKQLTELLNLYKNASLDGVYACSKLGQEYSLGDYSTKIGGMICNKISKDEDIYLMYIRFEQIYYRNWAGEPSKEVTYKNGLIKIDPRASFESWKECVKGTCESFSQNEIDSVAILSDQFYTVIKKFNSLLEAKRLKQEKEKQEELFLMKKMESMQDLIENIAHQWRQPLNVISVGASTIRLKNDFDELNKDIIAKVMKSICDNSAYLSETIEDFKLVLKNNDSFELVSLNDTLKSFSRIVERLKEQNNINIIFDLDDDISIETYPAKFIQCFINFFNNSKDAFINKDISKEQRFIFISKTKKENKVIIEFTDSAGGIQEDIILKVFEPYFTTKHKYLGTGLSLSSSFDFIKNSMNGHIKLKNKEFEYKNKKYKGLEILISLEI